MYNIKEILSPTLVLVGGVILGAVIMSAANKSDLIAQDKTIASLEEKLKFMPVVTIDALGICSVTNGGKSYMLIDVTNELRGIEDIDDVYRAPEQEIEKTEKH